MYTINKETFEMVKEHISQGGNAAGGSIVKSKLTNQLVWKDETLPDPVRDYCTEHGEPIWGSETRSQCSLPSLSPSSESGSGQLSPTTSTQSKYSLFGNGSNASEHGLVQQQLRQVWDGLCNPNCRDCDYCAYEPEMKKRLPKHLMYAWNGAISCPLLLRERAAERKEANGCSSAKRKTSTHDKPNGAH